ncbi:MAG: pyridoxal phosphate-dependent aminotransferase [Elusimicrobia bacterium]|nr:pyridoxal phosphate-dependent aminotransferase [Elusimicrobiota bacterium]
MNISKLALELGDSPTLKINAKANQLKAAGEPVIHLGGGEPESDAPPSAIKASVEKVSSGRVKYTAVSGTPQLKKAVIQYTHTHYGKQVLPENIIITTGAKQALYNFMLAALDAGDEIIFPSPYWVSYPEMIKMCGGVPIIAVPSDGSFIPSIKDISSKITAKTRAIIINSPNNPSGAVYPAELIKEIVELCEQKGIYLVMDDIYHQLVFDAKSAVSCYKFSKDDSNIVVINGVSKLYGMTGFRIGWAVGNKDIIKAMTKIQSQTISCPPDLSQSAAEAALMGEQTCVEDLKKSLEKNRNTLVRELKTLKKAKVYVSQGTFYCFADFSAYNKDSNALSAMLLEKALVVTVPGKAFGMEGFLRISFCGKESDIIEGVKRMRSVLDN